MQFAVFCKPVVTIYDTNQKTKMTEAGLQSTISDEGLYGMVCRVLEVCSPEMPTQSLGAADACGGWVRVMTHYGYAGWVCAEDLIMWTEEDLKVWQEKGCEGYLALVDTFCADIMSVPKVQGHCYISLVGGAVVEVVGNSSGAAGWTRVRLLDGQEGYVRTQHLSPKRFTEDLLWQDPQPVLNRMKEASAKSRTAAGGQENFSLKTVVEQWFDGSETAFREKLVSEAMKYMGVQYRWGGKSFRGIDCSGLVSISYMRCGILIYRDASIVDGWPIRRLPVEDVTTAVESGLLKQGDALYFPGHIAMYIGDGKYIHSTGKIGSGGVVINSLSPEDPDFRQDLLDCLYAVGCVRM